ncbi:histidinol phosphatase [Haloplanus salinus]|uniref:histidinol-phosphatase n=1 Tax=Haloplanus salinus TaxID=1126245 RepID=A0A368N277_9EURY|nr:PHP domain-containing protein [Haloplanus salinus]RCU44270.1 histidinol phosphatase [Haloplanus salinus]
MQTDIHTHTTFSDGSDLSAMIDAAETAGLDALGLTDHCIVTDDAFGRRATYDLVKTYEQRREAVDAAREETTLTLYDAAEVSYVASEADAIREFLSTADFEYTIGSVHFADQYDYTANAQYAEAEDETCRAAVERYYDAVVELVESELFDVLGHLDLPERLPTLRGFSIPDDYERVAAALADSRTVPEINAGRVNRSLNRVHPDPGMIASFSNHGIKFVLGTDSHRPDEIVTRVPALEAVVDRSTIDIIEFDSLLS